MMQLHTNDFTLYRQHIRDRGGGGHYTQRQDEVIPLGMSSAQSGAGVRVNHFQTTMTSWCLNPSEQRVFDPAQTAAPILGSKPFWLSFKKITCFKNPFLDMMSVS